MLLYVPSARRLVGVVPVGPVLDDVRPGLPPEVPDVRRPLALARRADVPGQRPRREAMSLETLSGLGHPRYVDEAFIFRSLPLLFFFSSFRYDRDPY